MKSIEVTLYINAALKRTFWTAAYTGSTPVLGQWLWLMINRFVTDKSLSYSNPHNMPEDTTVSPSHNHFNFYC